MPILTTIILFGAGAVSNALLTYKRSATQKKQLIAATPTLPVAEQTEIHVEEAPTPIDNSAEGQLARAMPLTIMGAVSAIAGFINPILAFPAAFICGHLTVPLVRDGAAKFKKHRHIASLIDAALIPILVLMAHLLTASLMLTSIGVSRRVLEKTYDRSRKSLSGILNTLPKQVWLLVDGVEVEVDYRDIKPGDVVVVNNTDMVPVDGKVIHGGALIDQTMLTGEAVPAEKLVGDQVYAGTQVVSGRVFVEVEKSGDDTHAGEVSSLILNAADRRTAVQQRGEMVFERSLPPILAISGVIGLFSGLTQALGVYFVAPGYGMRVLSPLSLLQSLRDATDSGILIKDGRSLELLKDIDTVVFDKTGTLTDGELQVAQVIPVADLNRDTILSLAAAAENTQRHPIARAIVNKAKSEALDIRPLDDTEYTVARGIKAQVGQHEVVVGSSDFIKEEGFSVKPVIVDKMNELGTQGFTTILVGIDNVVTGIIALDQTVRPEAMEAIGKIKQRGMKTVIISGDAEAATRHMADKLGIDSFFAETLPGEKAQLIKGMQEEGGKVCFIGDGINDAAALKQAEVSLSIRGSSSIAVDTAQIVLVNANLSLLDELFDIADNYEAVTKYTTRLSVGLPLTVLPIVLAGGGSVLLVLAAHNVSTWSGLWRIMRKRKQVDSEEKLD